MIKIHYRPKNTISTELPKALKNKLTKEQNDLLKYNLFELEGNESFINNYEGCGFGYLEVTPEGKIIDLKYGYLEDGQTEQNIEELNFSKKTMTPMLLDNKNIRFYVNISSHILKRF